MTSDNRSNNVIPLADLQRERDDFKQRLLQQLPAVLKYLLPNGVIRHGKFYIGNIAGDRGESLVVQIEGAKSGLWHDFATGDGGDLFSLWGAVKSVEPKSQFP